VLVELVVVVSPAVVLVVVVLGATLVEVVVATVVVVGRTVEPVEVVTGLRPSVAAGRVRGRGRVVLVDEAPAKPPRGRRVVEGATSCTGASSRASPLVAGAVRNPIRLPPTAPSATATANVAHRRSMPSPTSAPVRLRS
jgi:hypothetical protein